MTRKGSWPAWKKNYYLYQCANFISLLGDFLGGMALHWWILEKSEGMTELSSIFLVGTVVRLVSLPLLGPVGDSFKRKKLLNFADTISCSLCLILAVFVFYDNANILLLCALTGLMSLASSLFRAGSFGMIPELVPHEKIPWAISQNQVLLTLSIILGGSLGSLFISLVGIFWTLILNAVTIALAIILIRNIDESANMISFTQEKISFKKWRKDFVQGLVFISKEKILLTSFAVIVLFNALLTPFDLILPYYIQKVRQASVWQLGLIESSIGIGSIFGSLLFGLKYLKENTLSTVFTAIFIVASSLTFFGLADGIGTLVILGGLFGVGEVLFFVPVRTKLVMALPHKFRSRVGVVFAFGQQLLKPMAVTMTGVFIESYSVAAILSSLALLMTIIIPIILIVPHYAQFLGSDNSFVLGNKGG